MLTNDVTHIHPSEVEPGLVLRFRENHQADWDERKILVMEYPTQVSPGRWRFWSYLYDEYYRDWVPDPKVTQLETTFGGEQLERLLWLVDDYRTSIPC